MKFVQTIYCLVVKIVAEIRKFFVMFYLIRSLYCTEEIVVKSLKPGNAQYFKSHYYAL